MLLTFDVSLNMPSHIWHINPDKVSPFNEINDSINKMKNSSVVADPLGGKKKKKKGIKKAVKFEGILVSCPALRTTKCQVKSQH